MKNLTEAELITLAKKGNERAFSQLFDSIRAGVTASMRYKFNNLSTEQIEDAVQESFLKAFVSLNKFKPEFKFYVWVTTICRNTILDQFRRTHREREAVVSLDLTINDDDNSPSLHTKITDGLNNPEESFMKEERKEFVHKMINDNSLSENAKAVVRLFYIEEKKLTEISDELNMPLSSVKTNKRRFEKMAASNYELTNY